MCHSTTRLYTDVKSDFCGVMVDHVALVQCDRVALEEVTRIELLDLWMLQVVILLLNLTSHSWAS